MDDSISSETDFQEATYQTRKIPSYIRVSKSIDKFTKNYIKELPYYINNLISKLNISNDDVYNCYICYKSFCGIFKKVITQNSFANHFQSIKCPYIELIFYFMDINKTGKIEWPEFLLTLIYLCMMKEKDMIELLFLLFDYDFDMCLNDEQYKYICTLFNNCHIQLPTNYEIKNRYCCLNNGIISADSLQLSYFSFSVYCQEDNRITDGLTNVVKILRNETLSEDKWWDMINQNDLKKKPINFHKYLFKHFNTISRGTDEATIQTSLGILFECCNPPTYHDYESNNDFYNRYLYREKCLTGNEMKIGEQQHSLLLPIGKLVPTNDDDEKEGIALVIPDNYSHI